LAGTGDKAGDKRGREEQDDDGGAATVAADNAREQAMPDAAAEDVPATEQKESDDANMADASDLQRAAMDASGDETKRADALPALFSNADVSALDVELRMAILQRERALETIRRDRLKLQQTRERMTDAIELRVRGAFNEAEKEADEKSREEARSQVADLRQALYASRDGYLANLESEIYQKQVAMEQETLKALKAQSTKTRDLKTQMNEQELQAFEQMNDVADRYNRQTQGLIRMVQEAEEKVRQGQVSLANDRVLAETRRAQSAAQAYDRFVKNEAKYDAANEKIQGEYAKLLKLAEELDANAQKRQVALEERIAKAKADQQAALAKEENKRADTVAKVQGELAQARMQVLGLTAQKNELEQEVREWRNMAGASDRQGAPNPAALTVFPLVAELFATFTKTKAEGVVGALRDVNEFMSGFNIRDGDSFIPEGGNDALRVGRAVWNIDALKAPINGNVHPGAAVLLQLVRRGIVALSLQRKGFRKKQRAATLVLVKTLLDAKTWFNEDTKEEARSYTPWQKPLGKNKRGSQELKLELDSDASDDDDDDDDDRNNAFGFDADAQERDDMGEVRQRGGSSRDNKSRGTRLWMVRPHAYHELFTGRQQRAMERVIQAHHRGGTVILRNLGTQPFTYLTSLEMELHDAMHKAIQTQTINLWRQPVGPERGFYNTIKDDIQKSTMPPNLPSLLSGMKVATSEVTQGTRAFPALFEDVVVLTVASSSEAEAKADPGAWKRRLGQNLKNIEKKANDAGATITVVLCSDRDRAEVMAEAGGVRTSCKIFPVVIATQTAKDVLLLRLFASLYRLLGYVTYWSNRKLRPGTDGVWTGTSMRRGLESYLRPEVSGLYDNNNVESQAKVTKVRDDLIQAYTELWKEIQGRANESDVSVARDNGNVELDQIELLLSGNPKAVSRNTTAVEAWLRNKRR
jgi:hypothetical protein